MRTALKAIVNVAATCGLAVWIMTWIAWVPGYAALTNALIGTSAWRYCGAALAWLRSALGANVGPESDELMIVQCTAAVCLLLAILAVWAANRAVRAMMAARSDAKPTTRFAKT